jgi:hypothetical protein
MKTICIPRPVAELMKQAFKDGEISITDLYNASSEQRRAVFGNYAEQNLAREINKAFEKAIVSKQTNALREWAESVFNGNQKKENNYKTVIDRI